MLTKPTANMTELTTRTAPGRRTNLTMAKNNNNINTNNDNNTINTNNNNNNSNNRDNNNQYNWPNDDNDKYGGDQDGCHAHGHVRAVGIEAAWGRRPKENRFLKSRLTGRALSWDNLNQ